jgi:hypothetical protein
MSEIVAQTTNIDSDSYKAMYIDWGVDDNYHFSRITEGSDFPAVKLTSGEREIKLAKYGVKVVATYEQLRRVPIDTVALTVQRIAVQAEVDKVAKVLDVLINGDGNTGTAAQVYSLAQVDPDAPTGLTLWAYLAWKMKFRSPYTLTTILGNEDVIMQLLMTPVAETGDVLANNPTGAFGNLIPMNDLMGAGVRFGIVDDAPAGTLVGFDRRYAIERVVEIGASITEVERWMSNQTEHLYLSEVEGFRVFDGRATRLLDITP